MKNNKFLSVNLLIIRLFIEEFSKNQKGAENFSAFKKSIDKP